MMIMMQIDDTTNYYSTSSSSSEQQATSNEQFYKKNIKDFFTEISFEIMLVCSYFSYVTLNLYVLYDFPIQNRRGA